MNRPAGAAGDGAAIEGRGVVGLHRAVVAAAVDVDRDHSADGKACVVHLSEDADHPGTDVSVDDEAAHVGAVVEAPVGHVDRHQIGEEHRTAGVPRYAHHGGGHPRFEGVHD